MSIFNKKAIMEGLVESAEASSISTEATESTSRINRINYIVFAVLSIAFVIFHLTTAATRELTGYLQRIIHLTMGLMMCFLLCPPKKKKGEKNKSGGGILGIPCALLVAFCGFYLVYDYANLVAKVGRSTPLELFCGGVLILAVVDCTRRLIGLPLPVISTIVVLYGLFGKNLPGAFATNGVTLKRLVSQVSLTTEGIMSNPLAASATVVVIFIIFASFLNSIGIGGYFVDLVMARFGKSRGAAAKSAVIGSALMGMLSGSVIANVMGTGTFTIPMMKKSGYSDTVSGAVEAVSSTGGQIMPPVMGAAAYIIAEILGIPFMSVLKAAIVPALLYYLAEFLFVHYEAGRLGLTGFSMEEVAMYRQRIKGKGYLLTPLLLLFVLMFTQASWPAQKCCFWAFVATVVIGLIIRDPEHSLNIHKIFDGIKTAASNCLECCMATACAGIIIGVFTVSGLGVKLSAALIALSGGHLLLLLILTMITSLILGMGLTTTGCYIILATLVAPTLIKMGVPTVSAHFFVFFFGIYSAITPPVAMGSYAASSLSGADPFSTGITSFRIALPSFIVPYVFVYSPALLLSGSPLKVVQVVFAAVVGVFFMALGSVGYFKSNMHIVERGILIAAGVLLIVPEIVTDIIGLAVGAVILFLHIQKSMKIKKMTPENA